MEKSNSWGFGYYFLPWWARGGAATIDAVILILVAVVLGFLVGVVVGVVAVAIAAAIAGLLLKGVEVLGKLSGRAARKLNPRLYD